MLIRFDSICQGKTLSLDWVGPMVLCNEELGRIPRRVPGIYIIHSFDSTRGIYPAIYVGKSQDLRLRLLQHLRCYSSTSPDIVVLRSRFRTYFSAAPLVSASERDGAESALIQIFRPRANRQVPRTLTLIPNLPPMTVGF